MYVHVSDFQAHTAHVAYLFEHGIRRRARPSVALGKDLSDINNDDDMEGVEDDGSTFELLSSRLGLGMQLAALSGLSKVAVCWW